MIRTGVYIAYHESRPGVYYVGSSSNKIGFCARFATHRNELRKNKHHSQYLQNVINKYGLDGLKFKIIQRVLPEYCIETEQFWINTLNTYKEGYNCSKIAGKVTSTFEEKRKATRKVQKKVLQIDKSNNIINKFHGVHEAGRQTNINSKDISSCCNNKVNMAGGYLWCFEENYTKNTKYKSTYNNTGVAQYSRTGDFIKNWESVQEASDYYANGHNGNISNCCKGKLKTAYGYKWKYNEK